MSKIISILKHKLITRDILWTEMDDSLPASDQEVIFYNKYIDEYRVCTLEKLEKDFKFVRTHFGDIIDEPSDEEWVDYQLLHTFHPTHWTPAPLPPYDL